ncbi:MAG: hypothetical protein GC181_14225 [Bacteroidetes bacterium]|nr:hypothetical protein [Bacteroidota bacterium]
MKRRILIILVLTIGFTTAAVLYFRNQKPVTHHETVPQPETLIDSVNVVGADVDSIVDVPQFTNEMLVSVNARVEEPVRYKNLQIFPITGNFSANEKYLVSLESALEKQMVRVVETAMVNELQFNNPSSQFVFLNAGDIVKGGQQDRTLHYDIVVAPKTYNMPIASFCVEHGRWNNRGNESVSSFANSNYSLSSRGLKLAARKNSDQHAVWDNVSRQQKALTNNIAQFSSNEDFNFVNASPSSLQLTLEDSTLKALRSKFKRAMMELRVKKNLIGLAYAINGEIYGVELYNNVIFDQLKYKLVDAFITEAIAEFQEPKKKKATIADVVKIIENQTTQKIYRTEEKINKYTLLKTETVGYHNRFVTYDRQTGKWLHLSIIIESEVEDAVESDNSGRTGNNNIIIDHYIRNSG